MQTTPSIDSLGLLLDLSVKLSLIFALAFIVAFGLRRSAAALRHMVWNLAFASVVGLPLLALMLPSWRSTWLPSFLLGSEYRGADPLTVCAAWIAPSWPRFLAVLGERVPLLNMEVAEALLLLWAIVSVLLLVRGLLQGVCYNWRCQRAVPVEDPILLGVLESCRARLGVSRRPQLLVGEFASPATFGWWRPRILLPDEALSWSEQRLRVVLLHELAHISHGDYPFNLMVHWVCALNWYNPMVWIAARAMRLDRECAADDCVIASGERELDYAQHLFEIAKQAHRQTIPTMALAMAHGGPLKIRVAQILDPHTRRGYQGKAPLILLVLAFMCTVAPLAAMQPQPPTAAAFEQKQPVGKRGLQRESLRDCEGNRVERSLKQQEPCR